jgi:hypothetical protein
MWKAFQTEAPSPASLFYLPSPKMDATRIARGKPPATAGLVKAKPQRHPEFLYMHVLYGFILNFGEGSV